MKREELIDFLCGHKLAVQATAAADGTPQAAVVGIAITAALEIVFDTVETSRKYTNLRADPRIALVIGWGEVTAQIEGLADFPTGQELDRIQACYFLAYPDGRQRLALAWHQPRASATHVGSTQRLHPGPTANRRTRHRRTHLTRRSPSTTREPSHATKRTVPQTNVNDRVGRLEDSDLVRLDRALLVFLGLAE